MILIGAMASFILGLQFYGIKQMNKLCERVTALEVKISHNQAWPFYQTSVIQLKQLETMALDPNLALTVAAIVVPITSIALLKAFASGRE